MVRQVNELLKELGWTDGFHVPVADDENKKLEKQVEDLLKQKADIILNLDAVKESVAALQRQFKNCENEETENQNMLIARHGQLEMEYTRCRLSESELNKLTQDINQMDKELAEYGKKQMSLQVEIDRMMAKLNNLKAQVQWGEEALLAWSEMVNKGIDEETTIEKFCQEDQARIEELNLERQKLRKEAVEREMELQNVVNGKTAGEFQMQQCGKLYKRALKQYRRHILYWNTSVSFLKDRDSHIKNIHKNITGIKKKAMKVYKDLNSKQKFRQQQIKTNLEVKTQVEETEKKLILMKQAINKVTNQNVEYQTQIKLVQGNLTTLGAKLAEQRSRTSIGQNKLEVKNSEIQQFAETYDQLRHQYERLSSETICQSETNIELEKLSEMTLDTYKAVSKDVEKLQLMLTNLKSELHIAEENATSRSDEIRLSLNTKEKLNKKLNDISVEFNRQQEIVYNSKYTLAKLMSKIAKYEGKQNDVYQKEQFVNRIHELEEMLENKTGTFQLINNQVKRTEDDLRKMTMEVDKGEAELRHLMDGRQDRLMTVDGGHKKLRNLQDSNQQLQVEQNLLELRVAQVEKNLSKHDDFVFSLEKQRLELESAMREKRLTIQAKKDILFAKKKIIEEEKSELKHSVDHLNTKKYQVQKRYEIAADMLGGGEEKDDSSGESDQVTKFKIKLAQEKSELQSKGDDLDAKIRKSEKEIYAMENTLRLINATNDSYKKNLSSIDSDSPEMEEKRELECKYTASVHNLKQQQQILKNTNDSIKALEKSLASTVEMEEKLQSEWRLKDKEVRDLDKELGDQQNKLIRADKQFRKTVREVRALRESSIPIQFAERDIEVRELQEINGCAIQQLLYLASLYVETGPVINRYLDEKGLSIAGFSCDSRRSKLKLGSSSLSLSPSALSSELGANSSRLSVTSERSTPSIINLDPFSTSQISKTGLSGNLSSQKLPGRKSKK